jgi:rod shape-determining protein MreD
MAFFFGLLLDFLSSSSFLGLNVTSYCAATALLYPQRRNFFADNVSTLPLLTFFSAVSLTMLQLILTYIFERHILITLEWAITNIVLFPLFDSMYAFAVFLLPSMLFGKRRRYGNDFFMSSTRMGP